MKRWLIVLAMLMVSMPAWGAESVQALRDQCRDGANEVERVACLGFISGATDMMTMVSSVLEFAKSNDKLAGNKDVRIVLTSLSICAKEITYGAMRQAFVNWATAHPEEWGHRAIDGLLAALKEKWPCRAQ